MKYIFVLLVFLPILSFGQKKKHWEIGINSTQLLRNAFAQNPVGDEEDFTFFIKRGSKNLLIRTHLGIKVSGKSTSFSGTGQELLAKYNLWQLALGLEKRKKVYKGLSMTFGADVLGSLYHEHSESFVFGPNGGSRINNDLVRNIGGFAPFLGLRYSFSKWLAISTESSLIVNYGQELNETKAGETILKSELSDIFTFTHSLPKSIYLVFVF